MGKTMKIYNGTSHSICIFLREDTHEIQGGRKLVLNPGASPVETIPPGKNLNAETVQGDLPPQFEACPIPLVGALTFVAVDPLPEGYDLYICSQMYRAAVAALGRQTHRLATVSGTVYESADAKRPCGCLALSVG